MCDNKYITNKNKFRAWNTLDLKWEYFNPIIGLQKGLHLVIDLNTLGQCSGFLDKNNREIYEGDIVNIEEQNETTKAKIVFIASSFMFEWLNDDCYSAEISDFIWNRRYEFLENLPIEVIGNIYENPELLE